MIQKNQMRAYLLFFVLILNACSGTLNFKHQPSKIKTPLPEKDFANYISDVKKQIKQATSKENLEDRWIEKRLPFEYKPDPAKCRASKPGVLLIHGLTDSPFLMRDIGERFRENCFWVRSILLPGHGTLPGDLLHIDYQ
ncbi:MAG: hypothetical protein VW455_02155 [Nitrospinota bacterium]